jgi:collagenase-like PrtC family protease
LTLGPLLFNWPARQRRDFYFRIADEAPVQAVCLGEVVCGKREPFVAADLPVVAARLRRAGKQVLWSTLALVTEARDQASLRTILAMAEEAAGDLVEANDLGAVAMLTGQPHAIGPYVNVYNEDTLRHLARGGARRVSLPFELPAASLRVLAAAAPLELEVQVFGRTPLAISARCYHARALGRSKNSCDFVCGLDADGMAVETLDRQPFLAINGTQTLSHTIGNLAAEIPALLAMGVNRFRLSPHHLDMVAVAESFRAVLDGRLTGADARACLAELAPFAPFANGFFHGREGAAQVGAGAAMAD